MNMPNLTIALSDVWPMIIGATIGSALGQLLLRRQPDPTKLRKQLGADLNRYSAVPSDQLDAALVRAASEARRGVGILRPILSFALLMILAGLSAQIYRDVFPNLPRWHSYCVAGLVAGLIAWPMQWLERRAIIVRLSNNMHSEQPA